MADKRGHRLASEMVNSCKIVAPPSANKGCPVMKRDSSPAKYTTMGGDVIHRDQVHDRWAIPTPTTQA